VTIFSVGHSTHLPDEFLHLIEGIDVVLDVRSHPTSRWYWWRYGDEMNWLTDAGVEYRWLPELGGWSSRHRALYRESMYQVGVDLDAYSKGVLPKQRIGMDRPAPRHTDTIVQAPSWTNQGLYDYSWYTTTREFLGELDQVVEKYAQPNSPKAVLMCCEGWWYKCHRSMIADVLLSRHDVGVLHLKSRRPTRPTTDRYYRHRAVVGDRLERYEQAIREQWRDVSSGPVV